MLTIFVWLALAVVALLLIGALLDSATTTELRLGAGFESSRADALLENRLRGPEPIIEIVIVQSESESLRVDDPEFRQRVE
jgi:hypothetical protein